MHRLPPSAASRSAFGASPTSTSGRDALRSLHYALGLATVVGVPPVLLYVGRRPCPGYSPQYPVVGFDTLAAGLAASGEDFLKESFRFLCDVNLSDLDRYRSS